MSEEKFTSWYEAVAEDPDYYTNTAAGQKELAEMIRKESERLIEELGKSVKQTREVIWLSRHCRDCRFFRTNGRMECDKWQARVIKPFYGKPIWSRDPTRVGGGDEKEAVVTDIDWNSKWKEISDAIVERAIDLVNGGYPYHCFTSR